MKLSHGLLAAAGLYATAAAGWIGRIHYHRAEGRRHPLPEWHALTACLTGPLTDGVTPSQRIKDTLATQPIAEEGTVQWPMTCQPLATDALTQLQQLPPLGGEAHVNRRCLESALSALAHRLEIDRAKQPIDHDIDEAYRCADLFVAPAGERALTGPKSPDVPHVVRWTPDMGRADLVQSDTFLTATFRLRFPYQHGYCRIEPDSIHAQCLSLPNAMPDHALQSPLVPTLRHDDTFIRVDATEGDHGGVFSLRSGKALFPATSTAQIFSAFVDEDGQALALAEDGEQVVLLSAGSDRPQPIDRVTRRAKLLAGHVLWLDDSDPQHLWAQPLSADGLDGSPTDLGVGFDELVGPQHVGCQTKGTVYVWAPHARRVITIDDNGYHGHVVAPIEGQLSCKDGAMQIAGVYHGFAKVVRCNATGCDEPQQVSLGLKRHVDDKHKAAVAIGDDLLVATTYRGVEIQRAKPDDLATAPSRVVFAPFDMALVASIALRAHEDHAYLIVTLDEGSQVIRVAADGTPTAITPVE